MTYVITAVISFIAGGIFGMAMMCVFQINQLKGNAEFENEPPENGG